MGERRYSQRTSVKLVCKVLYNDVEYLCNVKDVSREGMCITSDNLQPKVGETLIVTFYDSYECAFSGKTLFISDIPCICKNIIKENNYYRIGLSVHSSDYTKYIDMKQASGFVDVMFKDKKQPNKKGMRI